LFPINREQITGFHSAKKLKSLFLDYENVRGLSMKLPKLYADSSAFTEDILSLTET